MITQETAAGDYDPSYGFVSAAWGEGTYPSLWSSDHKTVEAMKQDAGGGARTDGHQIDHEGLL